MKKSLDLDCIAISLQIHEFGLSGRKPQVPIFALSARKKESLAKFDLLVTVIINDRPITVGLTAFSLAQEKAKRKRGR